MSHTWKTNDYRKLRILEKKLATLRLQSPDRGPLPTDEYARLKKKYDELIAKYGKERKFNKLHRGSTRHSLKTAEKKSRHAEKRKEAAELKSLLEADLA